MRSSEHFLKGEPVPDVTPTRIGSARPDSSRQKQIKLGEKVLLNLQVNILTMPLEVNTLRLEFQGNFNKKLER